MSVSNVLDDFRERYQLRAPRFIRDQSEIVQLDVSDGSSNSVLKPTVFQLTKPRGALRRKYVRSEAELGLYEEFRNPTGHILTAWEAYTAFGADTLEEAVERGAAILRETPNATGDALKGRRKSLNLSHKSVARAALVKESDVKSAETTPRKVHINKLDRIAFALGLDRTLPSVQERRRRRRETSAQTQNPPGPRAGMFRRSAPRFLRRRRGYSQRRLRSSAFSIGFRIGLALRPKSATSSQATTTARRRTQLGASAAI